MVGGADGPSGNDYRSLNKEFEQALKWHLDYDFIKAHSSFGPRISALAQTLVRMLPLLPPITTKALKEASPGQYKCPVVDCDMVM